ncbi:MAG: hypothetical protein B0D92_08675 [Spirochaeta sp. LUC14_002_19_P3]|nr:MAG: hypothetical protein B0D92_08675 [Spirochaeta sp. LUC14_002_19_P3]
MKNPVANITGLGHALCHVAMLVFPVVITSVQREFSLSLTQAAAVGTAAYMAFGLGAFPAGIMVRFLGTRTAMLLYFSGIGLGGGMIGLATTFGMFVAGMLVLGTAASIYHVAGTTMISRQTVKTGRSFGIHGIAGSGGTALGPLIAGLLSGWLGWRFAYLFLLLPVLCGLILVCVSDRNVHAAEKVGPNNNFANGDMGRNWRLIFVLMMGAVIINGFIYRAAMTVLPLHLSERVSFGFLPDVTAGGLLASLALAFGMAGMFAAGSAADKMDKFKIYALLFAVAAPALALMSFSSGTVLVLASIGFTLFFFPSQPVENSILGTYTPPRFTSYMFGVKFTLTFGLGSLGALTAGYLTEHRDSGSLFLLLAAASVLSCLLSLGAILLRRQGKDEG